MSLVTCNGIDVLGGSVIRPLVGAWTADLQLDSADGLAGGTKVTIQSENGYSLVGTVDPDRTGVFLDASHVRIIGGAAGMQKVSSPRGYVQPHAFAKDVLEGILGDAGEVLSGTTDAGLLATNVLAWSVLGTYSAVWNLRALLNILTPAMSWRVLTDGAIWIGNESWPTATAVFDTIDQDPKEGVYLLGIESPFVEPGTNLDGVGKVNQCVDVIESGRLRTRVYVDLPSEDDRDLRSVVAGMAKQAVAGVDFYGRYECQVETQSVDLTTVDVSPVGDRNKKLLGGLQRVPVRFGTGIKVKFSPGAHVLLGWDGGNPGNPYVTDGVSGESPLGIQLAGTHPAALFDNYQADMNALMGVLGIVVASGTVAGPLLGLALAYAGPPHVPPFATNADALIGLIASLAVVTSYQSQIVSNG